jgi:hypothetical protein
MAVKILLGDEDLLALTLGRRHGELVFEPV